MATGTFSSLLRLAMVLCSGTFKKASPNKASIAMETNYTGIGQTVDGPCATSHAEELGIGHLQVLFRYLSYLPGDSSQLKAMEKWPRDCLEKYISRNGSAIGCGSSPDIYCY